MIQIYGAGGHAQVIADAIRSKIDFGEIVFFDDNASFGFENPKQIKSNIPLIIGIGANNVRKLKVESLSSIQKYVNVIHKESIISANIHLGSGNFFAAGSILNTNSKIGNHSIFNTNSCIDHDCKIGSFCHFAPGTIVCGNVEIGENVFLGAGSTVIPGIRICSNVFIGAGSLVTKSIDEPGLYYGRPIMKK